MSFFFCKSFSLFEFELKKKQEHVEWDRLRRVHWDTPSRRAPQTLNVNKILDVYLAGFHLKLIYNYDCHRNNVQNIASSVRKQKMKAILMCNQIYILYVH